jgi:hypothetical protein
VSVLTQAQIARLQGASVRSMQRAGRIRREAPDLVDKIRAGAMSLAAAERLVIERENAAAIAYWRSLDEEPSDQGGRLPACEK